ncbi:MAG TPA: thioether cross-link-forming SCIFF peptide maturase, partial [Thermoanaerobacterales bacterium]|nr:thioether cross-link-forming SCIFF peptide maturase [Thermoanaerobacterales bacterium]
MTGQIHKFRVFDKDIVLDVNSGSIFEIDAMCSDILDLYNKYTIKDIIKT